MFDNLSVIISVAVALAAIASPVLTAFINNRYQLKLKQLELKQQQYENTMMHKRAIVEDYLKGLSALSHHNNSNENWDLYSQNYPLVFMFMSPDVQSKMSEANDVVSKRNFHLLINHVDTLSDLIRTELQKL
jgi:hypothetical protein